jgi:hypothetical protein
LPCFRELTLWNTKLGYKLNKTWSLQQIVSEQIGECLCAATGIVGLNKVGTRNVVIQ